MAAVLVGVAMLAGCGDGSLRSIPPTLQGYWVTDDPRYQNHPFRLDSGTLLFGQGDGQFSAHAVESVDTVVDEDHTLYTVRYRTRAGHTFSFQFRYLDQPQPTIRFVNQPDITWHRTADPF